MSASEPTLQTPVRIVPPYDVTRTHRVRLAGEGVRVLDYCAERFPWRDREAWRRRIAAGKIRLRDAPVEPGHPLRAGQELQIDAENVVEPAVPDQIEILHADPDWLLVRKPAPMPVHSGGRYLRNTLLSILQERISGPLLPVHRLDAVTTGLLCLARSSEAAMAFAGELAAGGVRKGYVAHVQGLPDQDAVVDSPIRRKEGFVFECASGRPSAAGFKPACTRFKVLARDPARNRSLVGCVPVTGRTHQIRLHLREWGHPVFDDPIYGPDGDDSGRTLQNRPIRLQNARLELPALGIRHILGVPPEWGFPPLPADGSLFPADPGEDRFQEDR